MAINPLGVAAVVAGVAAAGLGYELIDERRDDDQQDSLVDDRGTIAVLFMLAVAVAYITVAVLTVDFHEAPLYEGVLVVLGAGLAAVFAVYALWDEFGKRIISTTTFRVFFALSAAVFVGGMLFGLPV